MRSNGCTRRSNGGSRPRPCCRHRRPRRCCSGRCSPPDKSPCARSTAGRHWPPNRPTQALTSPPEPLPSTRRRRHHGTFHHIPRMKRVVGWGYAVGIEVGLLPGACELVFQLDPGTSSTPDCAKGRISATGARLLEFFDEVPEAAGALGGSQGSSLLALCRSRRPQGHGGGV